jgi:subtilisin family serine protease
VDIFAPGHSVTSAWNTSATASNTIGGTSMASPHVAGAAALALAANPAAKPADVAAFLASTATPNRLTLVAANTANLLLYSLGTAGNLSPPAQPEQTVAFKSMTGSSARQGGNWRASALVTVRDVNSGASVPNATVSGSFSPGGNSSCVTGSNGACTVTSGPIRNKDASISTLSGTGVSGTLLKYDASQNAVSQIVITKP